MKNLKKVLFTILCMLMTASFVYADCKDEEFDGYKVTIVSENGTKYCNTLLDAVGNNNNVKEGDVVNLFDDVTSSVLAQANTTYTINLNGHKITSNQSGLSTLYIALGTVTINGPGKIEHTENPDAALYIYYGSTATLDKGVSVVNETNIAGSDGSKAIVVGGKLENGGSNPGSLVVNDAEVLGSEYGIVINSDNSSIEINDGTIKAKGIAISGNGNNISTKATINGGNISSETTAAIYHPETGSLTITGGNITGVIGIVARQGNISITGGTIKATGNGDETSVVGDAHKDGQVCSRENMDGCVLFPQGVTVAVDNKTEGGYSDKALVTVTGGTLESSAADIIYAYEEDSTNDFALSGGTYISDAAIGKDGALPDKYITGNTTEVKVGNKYALGEKAAKEAVENATNGQTVEVLQGDLEVSNVPEGVTVTNKGEGKVEVDGTELKEGESKYIPVTHYSSSSEPEKDYTIVEGVKYEDNGDDIEIEGNIVTDKTDVYEAMLKYANDKGYKNLYKMYDFHVKDNKSLTNPLVITFDLGKDNDGKTAYILHQKHDNTYDEYKATVTGGKVKIRVYELSPFIVMLEDSKTSDAGETQNPPKNPNTTTIGIALYSMLGIGSVGSIVVLKKKKHN